MEDDYYRRFDCDLINTYTVTPSAIMVKMILKLKKDFTPLFA